MATSKTKVLVGDSSVGKSCLLIRFSDDMFNENYVTTIGVDFRYKTMIVSDKWDTAGQERYHSITTAYYHGASAIFVCCDLTNHESFENIGKWLDEIARNTDSDTDRLVLINKSDLVEKRKITQEEIEKFEKEKGIKVKMVSAKNGDGVEGAFRYMIEKLIADKTTKESKKILLETNSNTKGACCNRK